VESATTTLTQGESPASCVPLTRKSGQKLIRTRPAEVNSVDGHGSICAKNLPVEFLAIEINQNCTTANNKHIFINEHWRENKPRIKKTKDFIRASALNQTKRAQCVTGGTSKQSLRDAVQANRVVRSQFQDAPRLAATD
jgi:hypothetical protein